MIISRSIHIGWRSLVGCSPWGRDESDMTEQHSLSLFTFMHWRRKWQLTPVFLPGDSQGRGSLVGCCLWGHTESDTTEATSQLQPPSMLLQITLFHFYLWLGNILLYICTTSFFFFEDSFTLFFFLFSFFFNCSGFCHTLK